MAVVKGTTKNGFMFEYDNDVFADWEVMNWFTEILEIQEIPEDKKTDNDNMTLLRDMYAIVRRVFDRSQIATWTAANRDDNGNVVAEWMWADFEEMFLESEDKEVKNS